MTRGLIAFLTAFFLTLTFFYGPSFAQNRVDITPRRVILEPRERAGEFTLLNLSQEPGTYKIEIVHNRQDDRGTYTKLDGPLNPVFDPATILRLSPRQFTLPPEGRQKVRFSIRKPADLPDGEYRFHIQTTRMAEFGPPEQADKGSKVGMTMNIGTSIPIIVRHGNVEAGASLSDLQLIESNAEGKPELHFTIHRSGNASTIGTALIFWTPQGGADTKIGHLSNLNVFTENSKRFVIAPLSAQPQGPGTLRVVYQNDVTKNDYAEATLQR